MANIPKAYGGELDWAYGDLPNPGEEEKKFMGVQTVKPGPSSYSKEDGYRLLGTSPDQVEAGPGNVGK